MRCRERPPAQAYKMPSYLGEFADMNKAVRSLATEVLAQPRGYREVARRHRTGQGAAHEPSRDRVGSL